LHLKTNAGGFGKRGHHRKKNIYLWAKLSPILENSHPELKKKEEEAKAKNKADMRYTSPEMCPSRCACAQPYYPGRRVGVRRPWTAVSASACHSR